MPNPPILCLFFAGGTLVLTGLFFLQARRPEVLRRLEDLEMAFLHHLGVPDRLLASCRRVERSRNFIILTGVCAVLYALLTVVLVTVPLPRRLRHGSHRNGSPEGPARARIPAPPVRPAAGTGGAA